MLSILADAYEQLDPGLKEVIEISICKELGEKDTKKLEEVLNDWFESIENSIEEFSLSFGDHKIVVVLDDFLDKENMRMKIEALRKKIEHVFPGIITNMRHYRYFIEDQYMAS